MGHALNNSIQDVLIRRKRMQGVPTLWIPGTDHAGIATQFKVEQKLQKDGISKFDLGKEKFIEKVWEWKDEFESTILGQLRKIGCSCDWSRTRFTMDEGYSKAVLAAFKTTGIKDILSGRAHYQLVPKLPYLSFRSRNRIRRDQGSLWYIKYPLAEDETKFITVATTRPETMLGDTAVAVRPGDARYTELIGKKLILPLVNREIPLIADEAVEEGLELVHSKLHPDLIW